MKTPIYILFLISFFLPFKDVNAKVALNNTVTLCPAPIVSSFSPLSGPKNTIVTIVGSNFLDVTTAQMNGVTVNFNTISDTELTVTIPTNLSSDSQITLISSGGCSETSAQTFSLITSECDAVSDEIFISEVYDSDGGSYGIIELYNPTNTAINLDGIYEIERYGDIGNPTPSATIPLTGTINPSQTYIIEMGSTGNTCNNFTPNINIGSGINENDEIVLLKNTNRIDVLHTDINIGYTFIRNADANAPSTTFDINDWMFSDIENCSDIGMHTSNGGSTPNITQPISQNICENDSTSFSVSVDTGTYTYQWKILDNSGNWINVTDDAIYSGATTNTLSLNNVPFSFNNNQYYCEMVSATCNLTSDTVQLQVNITEVDTLTDQNTCDNYTLPTLTNGLYFTGPNGTGSLLNPGNVITASQTIYIFNSVGTCTNESSFTVTITDSPLVDVLQNQTACTEFTLPTLTNGNYFTASGGNGTALNAGDIITTSQTIFIYNEVNTSTLSCSNESSFEITISGTPSVDTLSNQAECSEFILPALTNGNYFTGSNGTGTQLNANDSISTSQTIFIYNEVGTAPDICTNESSFLVTIYPAIDFSLTDNNISISENNVTVTMSDTSINYIYAIDNQDFQTNNIFSNLSNGTHTLYVSDDNGCVVKSLLFNISLIAQELVIPNGFSPNDDGKNDWFNIQGLYDVFPNHKLEIYNRYGTLVFQGNNNKKWYGKANKGLLKTSNTLPVGTYFYVLNLNDNNTSKQSYSGWVYLNK
ncbi:gliding motility-associated C-terminal domain-containing protein [Psychroserpens sp. S379A]|uniref:T9SS type B sorting domain-containing protein n=1 Tax=Psychroserpens sp. S379A TaxID=3415137 RepID=UPI003C7E2F6A